MEMTFNLNNAKNIIIKITTFNLYNNNKHLCKKKIQSPPTFVGTFAISKYMRTGVKTCK